MIDDAEAGPASAIQSPSILIIAGDFQRDPVCHGQDNPTLDRSTAHACHILRCDDPFAGRSKGARREDLEAVGGAPGQP